MDNLFLLLFLASLICLILGLIKPTIFNQFIKNTSRKKVSLVFSITAITFLILFGVTTDASNTNTNSQIQADRNSNINSTNTNVKSITIPALVEYDDDVTADDAEQDIAQEDVSVPAGYTVVSADNLNITNPVGSEALVSEVIDGDTVRLSDGNKVRILGIDTPETKDPRKPVQCFGEEASAKMKELTEGKQVTLLVDSSQGDKDKYGRLLRYIYIGSTDIGAQMIEEGYAFAYLKYPVAKTEPYKALENQARENLRGLWSESTCNGSTEILIPSSTTTQPSSTNTNTSPTPVPAPSPTNTSTSNDTTPTTTNTPIINNTNQNSSTNNSTSQYTCDCSKTCTAMSSCEEAYYQLNTCGCSIRDNDNDGVPCESICPGG